MSSVLQEADLQNRPSRPSLLREATSGANLVLLLTLLLAFLMGGGSRADIVSLLALRPLSVCLAGAALCLALNEGRLQNFAPLWYLMALTGLVGLQIVPLPPFVWTSFPGREIVVEAERLMGLTSSPWRPLSLVPGRTYNALFALAVPLAVVLSFASLNGRSSRSSEARWVPLVLLGLGSVAVFWGAAQLVGPRDSWLYTYRITNADVPVGPFANRNHQAIFCASLIPLIAWQFVFRRPANAPLGTGPMLSTFAMVIVLLMTLLTGSRSGTALAALGIVAFVLLLARRLGWSPLAKGARTRRAPRIWTVALISAAFVAAGITAWLYTDAELFTRAKKIDATSDMRLRSLPFTWQLVQTYFPVGSGFGSFEFVFRIVEPSALLRRQFLNQAHNDFLQVIVEGGVLGALLLLMFAAWFVRTSYNLVRDARNEHLRRGHSSSGLGVAASLSALMVLLASIVDYPLRTPFGMAYFATLCCLMALANGGAGPRSHHRASDGDGRRHSLIQG